MSAFQTQFASARGGSDAIAAYQAEWNTLAACYQDLENILLPALKQSNREDVDFSRYVQDYEGLLDHIEYHGGQQIADSGENSMRHLDYLRIRHFKCICHCLNFEFPIRITISDKRESGPQRHCRIRDAPGPRERPGRQ